MTTPVFVFVGPPSAGKSTYASALSEQLNWPVVEIGGHSSDEQRALVEEYVDREQGCVVVAGSTAEDTEFWADVRAELHDRGVVVALVLVNPRTKREVRGADYAVTEWRAVPVPRSEVADITVDNYLGRDGWRRDVGDVAYKLAAVAQSYLV